MQNIRLDEALGVGQAVLALLVFIAYGGPGGFVGPLGLILIFAGPGVPLATLSLGRRFATTRRAQALLTIGLAVGGATFTLVALIVAMSREPMAPILLIVTGLGIAALYVVLLAGVWALGRQPDPE